MIVFGLFVLLLILFFCCNYHFESVNNPSLINEELLNFEKSLDFWYPLGNDFFRIDHGKNYTRFFSRLGKHKMIVVRNKKNKIVATGSIIDFKTHSYVCDFKVDKNHRGNYLASRIFAQMIFNGWINKWYCISMMEKNKTVMDKILWFANQKPILIYSLDYSQMLKTRNLLNKSFVNLSGIKSIIMKNGEELKIAHMEKNGNINFPLRGYTHMFCVTLNNPLVNKLNKIGITTNVKAKVFYWNMNGYDFDKITTSII